MKHPLVNHEYAWVDKKSHDLIVNKSLFFDLPHKLRYSKLHALIRLSPEMDKCFFTGMQCYIVHDPNGFSENKYKFAGTSEHLLNMKLHGKHFVVDNQGTEAGWTMHLPTTSIVIASAIINHKVGHIPAILKILIRRMLATKHYNRFDQTNSDDTYGAVLNYIIDFQNQFLFHGKYPWQPWTYTIPEHKQAAQEFLDKLLLDERELFSEMTLRNRYQIFDNAVLDIE